jgi:amicyanin
MRLLAPAALAPLAGLPLASAADAVSIADPAAIPADAETVEVTMKQMKFNPKELTVAPGTTVVWVNQDAMPHDVKFRADDNPQLGHELKSPMMRQSGRFAVTFNTAGTCPSTCTPHPVMKATVTVGPPS